MCTQDANNIIIRTGEISDVGDMADIFNYYIENSTVIFSNRILSADDMCRKLSGVSGRYPFYVGVDGTGTVVGYCYAHQWLPDEVYARTWEVTIYLRHDMCGCGLGSRLLDRVIADSRSMGAHVLISFITEGNVPCEKMHRKSGFKLSGVIADSGYKFGRYLNDAIYTLKF